MSLEAEQALLGAVMLDARTALAAIERAGMTEQDLLEDEHRPIYAAMRALNGRGEAVDALTVFNELQAGDTLARNIPRELLHQLAVCVPSVANAATYARLVLERSKRQRIETAARALATSAASPAVDQAALTARVADAMRELEGLVRPAGNAEAFVSYTPQALLNQAVEPLGSLWGSYVPLGLVTVLSGNGGVGKSLFALYLAVHVAAGLPCFGLPVKRSRIAFFSGEDGAAVLHHRLKWICRELGVDAAELDGWMHLLDATDGDPALFREVVASGQRVAVCTATYAGLADYLQLHGIEAVIVDNMSDAFDGNEIDRAKVSAFMRSLPRLRAAHVTVVLLAHVDKGTARGERDSTQSYSGSTAVNNKARSRLALKREKDGALVVEHQKVNHGPLQEPLRLVWPEGQLPQLEQPVNGYVAAVAASADVRALLRLIHEFASRGEFVSPAVNSPSSAPRLLASEPGYPRGRKPSEVAALLRDAERDGLLIRDSYRGRDRHERERWTVTWAGCTLIGADPAGSAGSAGS